MTIKLVQFYDNPKTYPRNLHTPKLFIFLKTPKNIEIQKFEPQNMVRAYVYMKISVFPSRHSLGDPSANIFDVTTRKFFRMENLSIFIDDNNTKTIKVAHNHCFLRNVRRLGRRVDLVEFSREEEEGRKAKQSITRNKHNKYFFFHAIKHDCFLSLRRISFYTIFIVLH